MLTDKSLTMCQDVTHPVAGAEGGQGGTVQRFMHHVGGEAGGGEGGGGEADAVDGDAVTQMNVLQHDLGLNFQDRAVGAFADGLEYAHFFHDAGKHLGRHLAFYFAFDQDVLTQPGEGGGLEDQSLVGVGKALPPDGGLGGLAAQNFRGDVRLDFMDQARLHGGPVERGSAL